MLNLINSAVTPNVSLKNKVVYYSLITEVYNCNVENDDELKKVKQLIREKLANKSTRVEGLLCFEAAVQKSINFCPENWESIIAATLSEKTYSLNEIGFRILNHLIKSFASSNNQTSFGYCMPLIIPSILKMDENDEHFKAAVKCLSLCMTHLPACIRPYKNSLEDFLLKNMNHPSTEVTEAVAECFAALPSVSQFDKTNLRLKLIDLLFSHLKKILRTMNSILDELDGVTSSEDKTQLFAVPSIEDDEYSSTVSQINVLATFCKCLIKLISLEFKIRVPVEDILNCIYRVFEFSIKERQNTLQSRVTFFTYPVLQTSALLLLEKLILNFNFHKKSGQILHIIKKSVSFSKEMSTHNNNIHTSQVRVMSWRIFNVWLLKFKSRGLMNSTLQDTLIEELFEDIKIEHFPYAATFSTTTFDQNKDCACDEALKVLETMISVRDPHLNLISEKITSVITKIVKTVQAQDKCFPFPYNNSKCRESLYAVVLAISVHVNAYNMKWLSKAIHFLKTAQKDPDISVIYHVQKYLSSFRLLLHQKKPPPDSILLAKKEVMDDKVTDKTLGAAWDDSLPNKNNCVGDIDHDYLSNEAVHEEIITPTKFYEQSAIQHNESDTHCNGGSERVSANYSNTADMSDDESVDEEPVYYADNKATTVNSEQHSMTESMDHHEEEISDTDDHALQEQSSVAAEDSDISADEHSYTEMENAQSQPSNVKEMHENGLDSLESPNMQEDEDDDDDDEEEESCEDDEVEDESNMPDIPECSDEQPLKKQKLDLEEDTDKEKTENHVVDEIFSQFCSDSPPSNAKDDE